MKIFILYNKDSQKYLTKLSNNLPFEAAAERPMDAWMFETQAEAELYLEECSMKNNYVIYEYELLVPSLPKKFFQNNLDKYFIANRSLKKFAALTSHSGRYVLSKDVACMSFFNEKKALNILNNQFNEKESLFVFPVNQLLFRWCDAHNIKYSLRLLGCVNDKNLKTDDYEAKIEETDNEVDNSLVSQLIGCLKSDTDKTDYVDICKKYTQLVQLLYDISKNLDEDNTVLCKCLSNTDKTQDKLLHDIEAGFFTERNSLDILEDLQKIRNERRMIKTTMSNIALLKRSAFATQDDREEFSKQFNGINNPDIKPQYLV